MTLSEMFNRNVFALQLTILCELAEGVNALDQSKEAQKLVMDDKNDSCSVGAFILCPQAGGNKLQERFWTTSAASITEGPAFSSADLQKHNRGRPEEADHHGQPRRITAKRSCEEHPDVSTPPSEL